MLKCSRHNKEADVEQTYYRYPEAAEKLGIAVSTLRRWVSQGNITTQRLGRRMVRFTDADLASAYTPAPAAPPASRRRRSRR
jgi:excisionase family DNA binding protein